MGGLIISEISESGLLFWATL